MQRNRPKGPGKRRWILVEDNGPSGFKRGKGQAAKAEQGIKAIAWPKYSPDLNPLDFTLWKTIETRARAKIGKRTTTAKKYKEVLRAVARGLQVSLGRRAVDAMLGRITAVCWAQGGNNPRD